MPTNENEQTAYEDTTMQDDVYSENITSNDESNSDATGGSDNTSGNVSEEEIIDDVHNGDPMPTPPGVEPNGSEPTDEPTTDEPTTDEPTTDEPTIEILPNEEFPKDKEPTVGDEPAIKIPDDEIENPEHGGTRIYPIEFDPERRVVMEPVKQEPVEDNPTTIQPIEDPIHEYYEDVEADMDNKPSDEHKETFVPADDSEVPADDSENSHEDTPATDDPDASDASGDTGNDSDGTNDSSTGDSDDEKTEETEQPANDESRMHAFFQDIINKAIEHDIDIQGIANKVGIDLAAYGFVIKTKEELLNPTKDAEKTSDEPTDDKTTDTDKESDDPADDKTADDVATDTDAGKESDEEKSDQPIETIYTDKHPYPENSVEVVADTLVRNSTDKNDYAGAYSEASTGSENAITDGSNKVVEDYANKVKQNMAYVNRGTATIYQPQVDENGDMLVGEDGNPLYNEVKNEGATVADDSVPSSAKKAYAKQLEIFQSEHTQSMVYTDEELKAMSPEDSAMILAYEDKVKAEYMKETNCIYAEDGSIIDISNVSGSDEILTSLVDDKTSVYENSANTIMADAKSSYEMAQAETTTDTKTSEAGDQEMKANTTELTNKDVANAALDEFNNCMNIAKNGFVNRAALLTDEQQAMVDSIGSETAKDEAVTNMTNERLQKMAEVLGSDYVQMAEDFASGKSQNESEAEADV